MARVKLREPSDLDRSVIEEWERLDPLRTTERGALLAGDRAWKALANLARWRGAERVAISLERICRVRLEENGETPEALRDSPCP